MRRHLKVLGLLSTTLAGFVSSPAPGAAEPVSGDYFTRIRANDAPIGGRFSIFAYVLDSLDVRLNSPGIPGRGLLLVFNEATGSNSYLIPGDLALEDGRGRRLTHGLTPLGPGRLTGLLEPEATRYALWWVPAGTEEGWRWGAAGELSLVYGFDRRGFLPVSPGDLDKILERIPWDLVEEATLDPGLSVRHVDWLPNPETFDKLPEVRTVVRPEYPRTARRYDFTGTVRLVVTVSETGAVTDAFVLHGVESHDLNVAALVAVKDWTFYPGRKDDRKVAGDILVPIRFSEAESR